MNQIKPKDGKYFYSEIFHSLQGEGHYTGRNTVWLRFFGCNLNCNGFGQQDPTNPDTYDLPYQNLDATKYSDVKQLPVFAYGCDSSYSWAKKFKHLQKHETATEIVKNILNEFRSASNPYSQFVHPTSGEPIHMCFTGGEPMLNQECIVSIIRILKHRSNQPRYITIETNGTRPLEEEFIHFFANRGAFDGELFFSISPKLFTVSGEQRTKAIHPEVIRQYQLLSRQGQLKFVVGTEDRQWEEMKTVIELFRDFGINYPVWVMPVSGTVEGQQDVAAEVSNRALKEGYNVAARVHCYIYGNEIGT